MAPVTNDKRSHPPWVLSFDTDVDAGDLSALVGGKGLNLILLSRAAASTTTSATTTSTTSTTIQVPHGFCVTTHAYQALLQVDQLQDDIAAALTNLTNDHSNLDDVSKDIQAAFHKRPLPKSIQDDIQAQIQHLQQHKVDFVAVRSSATCEDLGDASFAGQHDTYLQVPLRLDAVCTNVVDCCASLYTARAIAYRTNHNVSHDHAHMAVVVQTMVDSVASGVLFTAHPLTGHRHQLVLEAVGGLGEALVSGLTEPDRYVIMKQTSNDPGVAANEASALLDPNTNNNNTQYKILDQKIGAKKKTIRPNPDGAGGVQVVELEQNNQACPAAMLSETTVLQLAHLGTTIQDLYDHQPQDVEWALGPDQVLYVVQSRPITTLFPVPPPSTNNNTKDDLEVFFSFGAVQGFAVPIFPAGQDAAQALLGSIIRFATGGRYTGQTAVRVVGERLFPNVTRLLRNKIGRKLLRKFVGLAEPGILAGADQVLEGEDRLEFDSGMTPRMFWRMLQLVLGSILPKSLYAMIRPEKARDYTMQRMDALVAKVQQQADGLTNNPNTTLADVVQLKRDTLHRIGPDVAAQVLPRMPAVVGPMLMLTNMARKQLGDQQGKDRVQVLVRGLPHNPTTEMDLKLWSTAQAIRHNDEAKREFQTKSAQQLADEYLARTLSSPVAQAAVQEFMELYGMRGLYEIDFGRPRWREEPAPLMQTLQNYVDMDEDGGHAPDELFRRGKQAAHEAIEQLGQDLHRPRTVRFLARRFRVMAALREIPKFTIVRLMGIVRAKLIEQGEKLVAARVLEHPRDVFLLHDDELEALSAFPEDRDWKGLVAERKAIMDRETSNTRIPRVLTTDGFGYYGGAPIPPGYADKPNVLIGEPVSPGTVEGTVRVVYDPSKTKLVHGEVLVCHGTDPSWTPLFLSACALVMEVGGLVTHGSIVAREVGIPAVVGVDNVTDRLKSGQRIRVDGSTGIVEILEDVGGEEESK